jgi:uncharacterized membrane protein
MNTSILATAFTATLALLAVPAQAADGSMEKCYGIARAGQNNCADAAGMHSCAAKASKDMQAYDWKYVDKGTCGKYGGSLSYVKPK